MQLVNKVVDACVARNNALLLSSELSMRTAVSEDVPTMIKFVQKLADHVNEPDAIKINQDIYQRDGFQEYPLFHCILLEYQNVVVGIAFFYFLYSTWERTYLHLEDLYIDQEQRGKGAGKVFMYTLADIANSLGYARFTWEALDWNTRALDFYKKIGSEVLSEWLSLKMDRAAMDKMLDDTSYLGQDHKIDFDVYTDVLHPEAVNKAIDGVLKPINEEFVRRNNTPVRFRRAETGDMDKVLTLVKGLASYEKLLDDVRATVQDYQQDGFAGEQQSRFHVFLMEDTSTSPPDAIGMFFLCFGYSSWEGRFLYLEDLYIEKSHRGQGAGKMAMYAGAAIAKSLDCGRFVWKALDWNTPALEFYERIGAKVGKGVLNLRMDRTAIPAFLATRPFGAQASSSTTTK